MNRRQFLTFSAATAGVMVVGVIGGTALVFEDSHTYIPSLLRELVGDYNMEIGQQRRFVDSFAKDYGENKLMVVIGLHRIRAETGLGIARTNAKLNLFERRLLTDFLTSTDYLRQPKSAKPQLSFVGYKVPCNNPYAQFS